MSDLPTGTVTFLLTDIEGSTRLWEQDPEAMRIALDRHDALTLALIERHEGCLVKSRGEGDSLFAVFARATDAVAAACELQRAFYTEAWPETTPLRVRIALHTGEADLREGDYYGTAVNRCARLRGIAHGGQVLLSRATQELVQDDLPPEIRLLDRGSHRLRDLSRPEYLFQLTHPDLPSEFPPLLTLDEFSHNLPVQLTRFIGREREISELKQLLSTTRLLTLTGTGGCGKTRLALQVAAEVLEQYPDGVWFAELAALTDPSLVAQTVAGVWGLREEAGRSVQEVLLQFLRSKHLLLVLDNCEHVIEVCPSLIEEWLKACPQLKVLTTSREVLQGEGERVYRVPSLSLPEWEPGARPSLERLTLHEAVQLFIDRAVAVQPSFSVTNENAAAVAFICWRLDGLPLAIELAAGRVKLLSVEDIAHRLGDQFRLLTGGRRTALPRHQTLRACIDWSYTALNNLEQTLLQRLAVFRGGWTLEAAERVCRGGPIEEWEILDLLTGLVEKSLVIAETEGVNTRYRLLEMVREYTQGQELWEGEKEVLGRRHRDFYLDLAERTESHLQGTEQGVWLQRLEQEHGNLRGALQWGQGEEEGQIPGLRLAGALWRFWYMRGYLQEGRHHLAGVLSHAEPVGPVLERAQALLGAGVLALGQGALEEAQALLEESVVIARQWEDQPMIAHVLNHLGNLELFRGERTSARAFYEESLALQREWGDQFGIANALGNLGNIAYVQEDYETARSLFEESLAIRRELGDQFNIAYTLNNLGLVARDQGDVGTAQKLWEESLALEQELGDQWGMAYALCNLGAVVRDRGDLRQAHRLLRESLDIVRNLGDRAGIAQTLEHLSRLASLQGDWDRAQSWLDESLGIRRELGNPAMLANTLQELGKVTLAQGRLPQTRSFLEESLALLPNLGDRKGLTISLEAFAALACAEGEAERAVRLWGAAEAWGENLGPTLAFSERAEYDRQVALVRSALSDEAFATAWAEGRAMPLEEALAYARAGPEEERA